MPSITTVPGLLSFSAEGLMVETSSPSNIASITSSRMFTTFVLSATNLAVEAAAGATYSTLAVLITSSIAAVGAVASVMILDLTAGSGARYSTSEVSVLSSIETATTEFSKTEALSLITPLSSPEVKIVIEASSSESVPANAGMELLALSSMLTDAGIAASYTECVYAGVYAAGAGAPIYVKGVVCGF